MTLVTPNVLKRILEMDKFECDVLQTILDAAGMDEKTFEELRMGLEIKPAAAAAAAPVPRRP